MLLLLDEQGRSEIAIECLRKALLVAPIPEPFFVHSDLTTGIQIADLIAYCLSWAYRLAGMSEPARAELAPYIAQKA
jgi:Protein of unknown function (DUF3800)